MRFELLKTKAGNKSKKESTLNYQVYGSEHINFESLKPFHSSTLDDTSSGGIQVFSRNVNVAHAHTRGRYICGSVCIARLIPLIYQKDPLIA